MGIIAWIVLGIGAGLLANMLIPGKRQQGLILTCLIGIAGALLGGWAATKILISTPCTDSSTPPPGSPPSPVQPSCCSPTTSPPANPADPDPGDHGPGLGAATRTADLEGPPGQHPARRAMSTGRGRSASASCGSLVSAIRPTHERKQRHDRTNGTAPHNQDAAALLSQRLQPIPASAACCRARSTADPDQGDTHDADRKLGGSDRGGDLHHPERARREYQLPGSSPRAAAGRGPAPRRCRRLSADGRRRTRADHPAARDHATRPSQGPCRLGSPMTVASHSPGQCAGWRQIHRGQTAAVWGLERHARWLSCWTGRTGLPAGAARRGLEPAAKTPVLTRDTTPPPPARVAALTMPADAVQGGSGRQLAATSAALAGANLAGAPRSCRGRLPALPSH